MKPLIFVVNESDKGNVIIERNSFEEMLELCYEQGYQDGKQSVCCLQYDYPTSSPTITYQGCTTDRC